jgi:hypothetical protein
VVGVPDDTTDSRVPDDAREEDGAGTEIGAIDVAQRLVEDPDATVEDADAADADEEPGQQCRRCGAPIVVARDACPDCGEPLPVDGATVEHGEVDPVTEVSLAPSDPGVVLTALTAALFTLPVFLSVASVLVENALGAALLVTGLMAFYTAMRPTVRHAVATALFWVAGGVAALPLAVLLVRVTAVEGAGGLATADLPLALVVLVPVGVAATLAKVAWGLGRDEDAEPGF